MITVDEKCAISEYRGELKLHVEAAKPNDQDVRNVVTKFYSHIHRNSTSLSRFHSHKRYLLS